MNKHSYNTIAERDADWTNDASSVFKILADSTRCKIFKLLIQNKNGMCVGEIAKHVGVSNSAISHQLNRLEEIGVLKSIKSGQTVCYEIADTRISRNIVLMLKAFFA